MKELPDKKSELLKLALKDLRACMIKTPEWAPGLVLDAEGYETTGPYRKD